MKRTRIPQFAMTAGLATLALLFSSLRCQAQYIPISGPGSALSSLGMLAVGAALSLNHQGKDQILVGEIAAEVNRRLTDRGERIQCSPEKVGHCLKKAGLLSRRLGAAGNGFVLDHATQVLIHEVAAA